MFLLLLLANAANAALPNVDYNRMGTVGLAGSFAGIDFFQDSPLSFDSSTSTLFSRTLEGALAPVGTTNNGGQIFSACTLDNVVYIGGSFSSIGQTSASNVASYRPSSSQFSALGSNSPNGEVDTVYCDSKNGKVWVGGKFTSPGASVAVWDPKAGSWSPPPFNGVSGGQGRVLSISSNSTQSSLFLAGSFVASFGAPASGNNNPRVPQSAGATPFSSSLVPVPIQDAQIEGAPNSGDSQFGDIKKILCPAGPDGPGNTWFARDGGVAVITARAFSFITARGVRLGNTFLENHGTSEFSVTTIPDNTVQTLTYFDPESRQNKTCSDACPLLSDSSIPYQDFLFSDGLAITGVQIRLSKFTGSGAGLHMLQLLSSGAFASSVDDNNLASCFSTEPSSAKRTGNWEIKVANTGISGTTQSVLASTVDVGTAPANGPTFTWMPYVSASGNYELSMMIPGCTNLQDCDRRTSVTVTVFPGNQSPSVTTIDQTNRNDESKIIYSGPIVLTSPDFSITVTMRLADNPTGQGQDGKYELIADRIALTLKSPDAFANGGEGSNSSSGALGGQPSFGFLEWPLSSSSKDDATKFLPKESLTALDMLGTNLFTALNGTANAGSSAITSVVHHSSGTIFAGGNLTLASGAKNVISFASGTVAALGDNGVDGPVTSMVLVGDVLFVGGSFQDTVSKTNSLLKNVGAYDIQTKKWNALGAGLNGAVTGLNFLGGKVQVTGSFTQILTSSVPIDAPGLAVWDTATSAWVNSGGFITGKLSMISNGTDNTQWVAGNVAAARQFGASGMVTIDNNNGKVHVSPLETRLESVTSGTTSAPKRRSVHHHLSRSAWMSHSLLPRSWSKRQTSTNAPTALPEALPAPAPAVLAGAFWTNSSSKVEVTIIGGNFSFVPTGAAADASRAEGVAIYDKKAGTLRPLQGSQVNGTVRALFVENNSLYVGGQFTIPGTSVNGFAIYDLVSQKWAVDGVQTLQPADGSTVVVRSISSSRSRASTIIVAGSFAKAGSLGCKAICALDTTAKQWNNLGTGISGEVSGVAYGGGNQEFLVVAGSLALSDNTAANVVQYTVTNNTWGSLGSGSDIPGAVTAVEVNGGNINRVYAAGKTSDGTPFLVFYNGNKWSTLPSNFQKDTVVSQLAIVPVQEDHGGNADIVEKNRMLMISGSLDHSSFGKASSALFDGSSFIPYFVSSTAAGSAGFIASLFHSFVDIDFNHRKFLATGIVILISIAIAAGIVFLIALIGILWTLFSRRDRDDKFNKHDPQEEEDDSLHHRPSSLLEHVNAATRGTIVGASPSPFHEKGDEKAISDTHDHDPYGPDASNYVRAETPSDIMGGMGTEEASRPAHARYSFDGAGEGELALTAGAEVEILDDRDHAWWYARDVRTGREGVVPAAYLY